jgi:hypothetical protein
MTDLLSTIGELAGKAWRHLSAEGEQSITSVAKAIEADTDRLALAIGWLAREDKVTLRIEDNKLMIALKENAESG